MAINIPIISDFDGKGINKAIKEFKQLETAGEKAQFALKKAAVPAAAALGALALAAGSAAKAAMEDQASQAELARTLEQSTNATDAQIKSVEDLVSKMTLATGVADTDLRNALATLARGMGDTKTAQDNLNLALDISAATGKDLTTVSEALAKAYNGNETALAKLDPTLRAAIKEGASFDEIGKRLADTFGGAAATAAETSEGKFNRMKVAIGETQESIGQALLPIIEKLLPILQSLATFVQNNTGLVVALGVAFGTIATAVIAANAAMTAWTAVTKLATAAQAAFNIVMSANPLYLAAAGFIALTAAAYKFRAEIETINEKIDDFFDRFGPLGKIGKIGVLKSLPLVDYFLKAGDIFKGIFGTGNGGGGDLGPAPGVRPMATGGIVTSPTLALIGEAGPEAVIPLDRMGTGGNNITINVNGGDPNAVVAALRRYMQMNGSVPIRTTAA